MSQGVGQTHNVLGQVDTFGGHFWSPLDYSGSAAYVQGGDSISPQSFGFNNTIWTLVGGVDQSGTWNVVPRALNNGVTPWQLVWICLDSGSIGGQAQVPGEEAVAGTNLSTYTVRLSAIGY
ncbi:MAG: hypothetical protein WA213_20775 [Terriglobales bacterium]